MGDHVLHSERLRYRPCTTTDIGMLHAHWIKPEVRRFVFDDEVIPVKMVENLIKESDTAFHEQGYGHWVIKRVDDDAFIGYVGMRHVDEYDAPELLYSIEPAFWGDGMATETARRILAYALEDLAIPVVRADIDPPNVASGRVLEKIGMARVGEHIRDDLPVVTFESQSTAVGQ